jgi:hypothetical protein
MYRHICFFKNVHFFFQMHILFYIVIILPQRLKLKNTALHQVRPIGADIPRMQSLP